MTLEEFFGHSMPGIGQPGHIEDCSIAVAGDPGCVTVTFSHMSGNTLLVLDPGYADILAEWLTTMAKKAREPQSHLTVVKG